MNKKQIASARRSLVNAGSPADRENRRLSLIRSSQDDIEVLTAKGVAIRDHFRRFITCWLTEDVPADLNVCASPQDAHTRRIYTIAGFVTAVFEVILSAWVFAHRLLLSPIIGVAIALIMTGIAKGALHFIYIGKCERPKESLDRIKRGPAAVAVAGSSLAIVLSVFGRTLEGVAALALLPFLNFGLGLGTLSFVLLAGCFFCAAHVYGTSERFEKDFRAVDGELRDTRSFAYELQRNSAEPAASALVPVPSILPSVTSRTSHALLLPALLVLAASMNSCAIEQPANAEPQQRTSAAQRCDCDIVIDDSGSVVNLEHVWRHVRDDEISGLVQNLHCTKLTIYTFDEDGWSWQRVIQLPLPSAPRAESEGDSEWLDLGNIRRAAAEEALSRLRAASAAYQDAVRAALTPLSRISIGPLDGRGTEKSDIIGLLKRLSRTSVRGHQYVIVLTDAADTQSRNFPKIPGPTPNVQIVLLLSPATAKDAQLSFGTNVSPAEQFDIRSRQLSEAVPWVKVVPFYTRDVYTAFKNSADRDGAALQGLPFKAE